MALLDDSANKSNHPPAKDQTIKVAKKDDLMEKKIKGLEKRVDCNAQVNRDKISSLDNRLTKLEAHYYSKFSQTVDTPPRTAESPSALVKSPPVPALKRKMDAAMEWERSMMSGEITLTGIEEAEANDEDEETRQNGVQDLQELGGLVGDQQTQIDQLKQQISQQSEQISFLVASMTQSQQTIASLQFDLDVERGRIADFETRLEDVEDSNDVRDASLILTDSSPLPSASKSEDGNEEKSTSLMKRKASEYDDSSKEASRKRTVH